MPRSAHPFLQTFIAGAARAVAVWVIEMLVGVIQAHQVREQLDALKAEYEASLNEERVRHAAEVKAIRSEDKYKSLVGYNDFPLSLLPHVVHVHLGCGVFRILAHSAAAAVHRAQADALDWGASLTEVTLVKVESGERSHP